MADMSSSKIKRRVNWHLLKVITKINNSEKKINNSEKIISNSEKAIFGFLIAMIRLLCEINVIGAFLLLKVG